MYRLVFCVALLCQPGRTATAADQLIYLRSDTVELGVLLAAGGRAVVLRRPGGENLLDSPPALWDAASIPEPQTPWAFSLVGGHMTWVSPQAAWWDQQHVTDQHASDWPPDPWLIHGRYVVERQTATAMDVVGPPSPICGLQLHKRYELVESGVRLTTVATNVRTTAVRWGLWSNLHPRPDSTPFIPMATDGALRVDHKTSAPKSSGIPGYAYVDGFFSIPFPADSAHDAVHLSGKFFLNPSEPWMASVGDTWAILVRTAGAMPAAVAPGEAPSEVYYDRWLDRSRPALLELEHQGPITTVNPGAQLKLSETWYVVDYGGPATDPARARFVRQWIDRLGQVP